MHGVEVLKLFPSWNKEDCRNIDAKKLTRINTVYDRKQQTQAAKKAKKLELAIQTLIRKLTRWGQQSELFGTIAKTIINELPPGKAPKLSELHLPKPHEAHEWLMKKRGAAGLELTACGSSKRAKLS